MKPILSIGLPTRNGAKTIQAALSSLSRQTIANFEIIISDNVSIDETSSICKKFAPKNINIRYYRQKKSLTFVENCNFVLSKAKGDYFMWASDDDQWHKSFAQKLIKRFTNKTVASTCNYILFNRYKSKKNKLVLKKESQSDQSIQALLTHPSYISVLFFSIYRTSELRRIQGVYKPKFVFLEAASDTLTMFQLLLSGSLAHTPEYLFIKRDSGYYLDQFTELKKLNFTKDILFRIRRFTLTPVIHVYICLSMYRIVFKTKMNLKRKYSLYKQCLKRCVVENIHFFRDVVYGITQIISGVFLKLNT